MKKVLTLLFGGVIALTLFVTNGNTAKAAELSSNSHKPTNITTTCACGDTLTILAGAERNKIVSDFLKSIEFKSIKLKAIKEGYTWNGAHDVQVIRDDTNRNLLVAAAFTAPDGQVYMFGFINGQFKHVVDLDGNPIQFPIQ